MLMLEAAVTTIGTKVGALTSLRNRYDISCGKRKYMRVSFTALTVVSIRPGSNGEGAG
jgi:hypothetical protein